MLAASLLAAPVPRVNSDTDKAADEFDKALERLRKAKLKLDAAANLYLERLEGTRRGKRGA